MHPLPDMPDGSAIGARSPQTARETPREANLSRGHRWLVLGLSMFAALSCVLGGAELIVWRAGNRYLPPLEVLRFTPFSDFAVPGLLLALVVGGAQVACAWLAYRRARGAVMATLLAGGILTGWVITESAMLRGVHILHGLYLAVGLAQLSIGVYSALRARQAAERWVVLVTAGELAGFAAPVAMGIRLSQLGVSGFAEVALLGFAGAIEGLLLGTAQAWAWPLPVRRLRYAALTALAACVVWVCAMSLVQLIAAEVAPPAALIALAVGTGALGLLAMGTAQWIELRHYSRRAWRFIVWTALAWLVALPFSFAPGPFVDEATPLASQLGLWSMGGLLMAAVMAMVTWRGVRATVVTQH